MLNNLFSWAWDLTFWLWLQAWLWVGTYAERMHSSTFFSQNYHTAGFWCAKAAFRLPAGFRQSTALTFPSQDLAAGWLRTCYAIAKAECWWSHSWWAVPCFFRASGPLPSYFQLGSSSLQQGKLNFCLHANQSLPAPFAFWALQEPGFLLSQRWDIADHFLHSPVPWVSCYVQHLPQAVTVVSGPTWA